MKEVTPRLKPGSPLGIFVYLTGAGFLIAGSITAIVAAARHFSTAAILSVLIAATGGLVLGIPGLLTRNPVRARNMVAGFQSHAAQIAPSIFIVALSAFLFFTAPDANVILALSAILIWTWIFGAGFLLFFRPKSMEHNRPLSEAANGSRRLTAFLSLLLACGVALVPSRIPGMLDGIPWDTPVEFVFVGLLLPLAFVAGQRTFSNKIVLASLGFLLVAKIAAMSLLPQSGLGLRAYSSESGMSSGQWEKSYYSLLTPSYTQVIQAPYFNYRQFPIESINRPDFKPEEFWADLEISGTARLQENERLIFLVQGARLAQIEMTDDTHQNAIPAFLISNVEDLNSSIYQQLPDLTAFRIQGTLVFRRLGQFRLEPLILYPSGSFQSALQSSRIWVDPRGAGYLPAQVMALQYLIDLIGLALIGIVSTALMAGILDLYRERQFSHLDLYLGASGLLALFVAGLVPKPQMNILIILVVGLLGGVKIAEAAIYPRKQSTRGLFFSIGIAFLLILAALEFDNLRSVMIFPQFQDGLEYQNLARNIAVNGDVFLSQTPPRAYKIIFPYLVGILHALFGQSASAQLFLNAWSGLLSSMVLARLMRTVLPAATSFTAAIAFLLILCLPSTYIYYFRFGLIEPVAILLLLTTCHFAAQRRLSGMLTAGLLTVLFRLDYLGAVLGAVVLTAAPITGNGPVAWRLFYVWLKARWKLVLAYALAVCLPPLLIILGYFVFTPNYVLNATDTRQTSLASVADSLLRVIAGGNFSELRPKFLEDPADALLLAIPLILGFLIACASLIYRKGVFEKIDLRLALLIPSTLLTYVVVRPTGYPPRFSLSLLPFDLIVLGQLLYYLFSRHKSVARDD